ncbi:MAG: hypothetical protein ACO2O0_09175 [Desulfurococcales archaeon]
MPFKAGIVFASSISSSVFDNGDVCEPWEPTSSNTLFMVHDRYTGLNLCLRGDDNIHSPESFYKG